MFFGVYDGHCGAWVAEALTQNLHKKLVEAKVFEPSEEKINYEEVFQEVFDGLDKTICEKLRENKHNDGSTCVTVSFTPKGEMVCAHAGDSRAIARVGGKALELTLDHDADPKVNKAENARVLERGGKVEFIKGSWRINSNLSVTRAFGDTNLKNDDPPIVSADAEVTVHPHNPDMDILIVCSDGLHHLLDNQETIKIAGKKPSAEETCLGLFSEIDSNTKSQLKGHDNTTVLTIKMRSGVLPKQYKCTEPL